MRARPRWKAALIAAVAVLAGGWLGGARGEQPAAVGSAHTPEEAAHRWTDPDGKPLPFDSEEAILEFLRTADVKSEKEITGEGSTVPHKLLLEKDGVRVDAIFRMVDETKLQAEFSTGRGELYFRDSYIYEPPAYELSRMLGLDNVPPATLRTIKGKKGSIQIWVENAMTDKKRNKEKIAPPDEQQWNKQLQIMNVFDELVYNTDRNRGNILITKDWKLWMIDHTRAFRRIGELQHANMLKLCERRLYQNIQALDEAAARERLKDFLNTYELDALFKRRKLILERFAKVIAANGEDHVFYTYTAAAAAPPAPAPTANPN